MKKILLIGGLLVAGIATAQAQTTNTTPNSTTGSRNTTNQNVYQTPTTPQQPGTVTQPSPLQNTNPFGTTPQEPAPAQPYNDYHLTQPSTSPVGAQIGTQNGSSMQPSTQPSNEYMRIESNQVPETLRQTLSDPQYNGWENSTLYMNRSTNEYSIDVGTGENIKNYRFDRDGNPVIQDQQMSQDTTGRQR